jgi:hypothetical protein
LFFMAIWAPFNLVEATSTDASLAAIAGFKTGAAVVVFARRTRANAIRAAKVVAAATRRFAFAADRVAALVAGVTVVLVNQLTAVRTHAAVPQGQLHKRRFLVIRSQNPGNQHEEIQQPALSQGLANGSAGVAFAKHFVHDVGMRDVFTAFGRMWILGDNSVYRPIPTGRPGTLQLNFERSEVNAVERDWFCGDGNLVSATIDTTLFKLLAKGHKVLVNDADTGNVLYSGRTRQSLPNGCEFVRD